MYRIPLKDTIEVRQSSIHHRGVFAKRLIKKGEYIIRYLGTMLTHRQAEELPEMYHFEYNYRYTIDGKNDARYINHSCDPNCETDLYNKAIWIVATRDIQKGEELSYNYGYDLEEAMDYPCRCGTKQCVGYILNDELWPKLKRKSKKRRKRVVASR